MAENLDPKDFVEDPLENLLDDESDEEFGLPEFKEHLADSLKPAKLKDWTAADFASIYVRFRPHLERHAKRFLTNRSQVEEVVQDAFLYLMTTLPELDSEVGVLKFLKWKTRLLALDVIRSNSRASFAPIDDVPEMAANVEEFNLELERADDAAIVAMAMAKLQPRHREALIATMYEEKSQEVVAAQMGMSENALRQLIFRARASFKKALVGEAEIQGKSMSQVLSIAARKAAAESGKYISAAGAFLLVLAISIGILPNLGQAPVSEVAEAPITQETNSPATESESGESQASENPSNSGNSESAAQESTSDVSDQDDTSAQAGAQPLAESVLAEAPAEVIVAQPALVITPEVLPTPTETLLPAFNESDFSQILNTDVSQAGFYTSSKAASFADFFQGESIEIFGGTGISAFVYLDQNSMSIENAMFQMWVDGKRYFAIARNSSVSKNESNLFFQGSNFYVVDDAGRVFEESPLANAQVRVNLTIDAEAKPLSAGIKVSN
jgi:RNA polymerase sigma-70 factor (ECF subfamily)